MYLTNALLLNSGPIEKLSLNCQFNGDGTPKPLVLVGANGSGKTNLLSILADAFVELASKYFVDVAPSTGVQRTYWRLLGGRNQRVGSQFELSALRFLHDGTEIFYRAKSGQLEPNTLPNEMAGFDPVKTWPASGGEKVTTATEDQAKQVFGSGIYIYFPANRQELPHWLNSDFLARDPAAEFSVALNKRLKSPIVVQTAIPDLKPWIIDLILDQSVDGVVLLTSPDPQSIRKRIEEGLPFYHGYSALNQIISAVLRRPTARIARLNRRHGERRICVVEDGNLVLPILDCLSSGQATLFSLFATIVRYADIRSTISQLSEITGIVVVDEVDAHLHADLQYEVLPALMKLFPRVQFIVSSHSPLFLLGLRRAYGETGCSIVEIPSGLTIDPERFTEFETSFNYYKATQTFELELRSRMQSGDTPLVLCEGQTDPKYLKTAAALTKIREIDSVEIDWVGKKTETGAQGSGASALDGALRFLRNNPTFSRRKVLILYDSDSGRSDENGESYFVRRLPQNAENTVRKRGIENLLPADVFEDRFFEETKTNKGDDVIIRRSLRKQELCDYLCDQVRNPSHFEKFRGPLEEIAKLVLASG